MKSKNILITIMVAMFLFGACTEEKIIDGPETVGKGSITLELAPSSIITKAGDTEHGYTYATEEELMVSSCWIYVVDHESGIIFTSKYFSKLESVSGPYDSKYVKGYKVEITDIDFGTYDFWVIANPTDGSSDGKYGKYGKGSRFSDLKESLAEGAESYEQAFSSTTLIKQGYTPNVVIDNTFRGKVEIPMTQLAARVELTLNMDLGWVFQGEYYEYPQAAISKGSPISRDQAWQLVSNVNKSEGAGSEIKDGDYFYLNHPVKVSGGKVKGYIVDNLKVRKVSKYKGNTFDKLTVTFNNIRTKAYVLQPAKESGMEKSYTSYSQTIDFSQKEYSFVFYTYNRGKNIENPLQVSLDGQIGNVEFQVIQTGKDVKGGYFIGDKEDSYVTKILNNKLNSDETLTFSSNGWGSLQQLLYITESKDAIKFVPSKEDYITTKDPVWKNYVHPGFQIKAPDDITEGTIKNGNLYTVDVTIKYIPTTGNLNVEIKQIEAFGPDIKFEFN